MRRRNTRACRARGPVAWVSVVLIVVVASAAQASTEHLAQARAHERAGRTFQAARAFLRAVQNDPGSKKARAGFDRVACGAVESKGDEARALADEFRFADAVAEWTKLEQLVRSARTAGLEPCAPPDALALGAELRARWSERLVEEAARAGSEGRHGAAVSTLAQARELRPDDPDVRDRLSAAWIAWGEQDQRACEHRAAAGRFGEAASVGGPAAAGAAARAGELLATLGRSARERGACRRAVVDLRAAHQLDPAAVSSDEIAAAVSCASTLLEVTVTADAEVRLTSAEVAELGRTLRQALAAAGSEHLVVRGPASGGGTTPRGRELPGPDGPVTAGPYRVGVRVTALTTVRGAATASSRRTTASTRDGGQVVLTYQEYSEPVAGLAAAVVRFAEEPQGAASPPQPVRVQASETASWIGALTSVTSTRSYDPWDLGRSELVVAPAILERGRPEDRRAEARAALRQALSSRLVDEVASQILGVVDTEVPVADRASAGCGAEP